MVRLWDTSAFESPEGKAGGEAGGAEVRCVHSLAVEGGDGTQVELSLSRARARVPRPPSPPPCARQRHLCCAALGSMRERAPLVPRALTGVLLCACSRRCSLWLPALTGLRFSVGWMMVQLLY